jgi:NAD+ synthase
MAGDRRALVYELRIEPAAVADELTTFIRRAVEDFQRDGAIVGLSGGIDSAVVAALTVRALGPERVLGLLLPERDSEPRSKRDALRLARSLSIRHKTVRLTLPLALLGVYRQVPLWVLPTRRLRAKMVRRYYARYAETLGEEETPFSAVMVGTQGRSGPWLNQAVAYHRVKVRLRMALLYYQAELKNLLMVGTDNKTELAVGFFVKYGDAAADVAPLAGLYKTQVRQLAMYLGVPPEIIARPPSPDLLPGLTDEFAIGMDYATLDRVLWQLEQGEEPDAIAAALGLDLAQVHYVQELTHRSAHMRAPPIAPPHEDL